jgi:hypothetical protein
VRFLESHQLPDLALVWQTPLADGLHAHAAAPSGSKVRGESPQNQTQCSQGFMVIRRCFLADTFGSPQLLAEKKKQPT